MQFKKITKKNIEYLNSLIGEEKVFFEKEILEEYSRDKTEDYKFTPELVVKPANAEDISKILQYCNNEKIPVTPRGGGTGLSGGALAIAGGIILSIEKLNKIIEIDDRSLQVTVEPGVITEVLQNSVMEKGLFYPPDPASKGSCFIGGNIAESAGGAKAVKYGTTKDYVLNLELVLSSGEIIWTGANVLKNASGYNLTQLIIGSEGTLGIITKIVLRLIPLPRRTMLMLVPFFYADEACRAVSSIFMAGITPSMLEFIERDAIDFGIKHIEGVNMNIKEGIQAHLLIEIDGNEEKPMFDECEKIYNLLENFKCDEVLFAESSLQKELLFKLRNNLGEVINSKTVFKDVDTVVPRAELPKLLKGIKEIGTKYNFKSICFGHAGDGNLHVNIIRENQSDHEWDVSLDNGIKEIFELCVSLGGTISGEHGIGFTQREYLPIAISKINIDLMKKIKNIFDPNGILNPSKIFL